MAKNGMDIEKKKCVTHEFRASFVHLHEPHSFEGKEAEYSLVMLFPKDMDLKVPAKGQTNSLVKAAYNAKVGKWGADKTKWPKNLKSPFRDGAERSDIPGYEDMVFVTAKSKVQPGLVDAKLRPILNAEDLYSGCYCRAEVIAFAYDQSGNKGVSFALQNVQKLRDGEPFSGRRDASEVFTAVEGDDEDEDMVDDEEEDGYDF